MHEYSFIIPAYNAGNNLDGAVHSIVSRIPDAEIIIVENGSTDNTLSLAGNLALENTNIILLQSEKGVSAARNKGIRSASGKWLIFVDADDRWVGSGEILKSLTVSLPDIAVCSYQKGRSQVIHNCLSKDVPGIKAWMMERPTQRMTVWAKLFRRDFLLDNNLFFDTDLWVTEDSEFLVRCLNLCNSVIVSDAVIYNNRLDASSVTRAVGSGRTDGHLDAIRKVQSEVPQDNVFMEYVLAHVNLIAVHEIFDPAIHCSWRDRIRELKAFLQDDLIRSQVDKVTLTADPQLLPPYLFKNKMYSIGGLICYLRAVSNRKAYKK